MMAFINIFLFIFIMFFINIFYELHITPIGNFQKDC